MSVGELRRKVRGRGLVVGFLLVVALALVTASAQARSQDYTATVSAPPRVQVAGQTYVLNVFVRNTGRGGRPPCLT
jgi:hypothetical protein